MRWTGECDNRVEMTFLNDIDNVVLGRMTAAAFVFPLNPTTEEMDDLKTAVSEGLTNAVLHAYPKGRGVIQLILSRRKNCVQIQITDFGKGIKNVKRAIEPLYTSCAFQEHSGMGFTFMEAFMDDMEVKSTPDCGTTVFLTKYIGREEAIASNQ